jgi:hypothetical protein
VASPDDPDGTELLLEPDGHPAAKAFKQALIGDGIPYTTSTVDDLAAGVARLEQFGGVHPGIRPDGTGDYRDVRRHLRQPDPDSTPEGAEAGDAGGWAGAGLTRCAPCPRRGHPYHDECHRPEAQVDDVAAGG